MTIVAVINIDVARCYPITRRRWIRDRPESCGPELSRLQQTHPQTEAPLYTKLPRFLSPITVSKTRHHKNRLPESPASLAWPQVNVDFRTISFRQHNL